MTNQKCLLCGNPRENGCKVCEMCIKPSENFYKIPPAMFEEVSIYRLLKKYGWESVLNSVPMIYDDCIRNAVLDGTQYGLYWTPLAEHEGWPADIEDDMLYRKYQGTKVLELNMQFMSYVKKGDLEMAKSILPRILLHDEDIESKLEKTFASVYDKHKEIPVHANAHTNPYTKSYSNPYNKPKT